MKRMMAAGAVVLLVGAVGAQQPGTAAQTPLDRNVLHVQVILDHLGFSPGMLDGKTGQSLTAAIKGFQESRGLPETGEMDVQTLQALYPYRALRPLKQIAVTPDMVAGPFVNPIPHKEDEQAKLPGLYYRNALEKLAEMFHTTPQVLVALNGGGTSLRPGTKVVFPNALPSSRDYDPKLREDWRATLNTLNVDAKQPQGDTIVVDKSDKVLRVMAGNKVVAQFQVTTGSEHDPLPLGTWKATVFDYNPKFHYNPALFWDASKGDEKAMLPAGPNGPVGVVWLDLTKEHYGIHGTPEPQYIGRTESHGCVRMANWNVARLTLMVKPGVKVIFQA